MLSRRKMVLGLFAGMVVIAVLAVGLEAGVIGNNSIKADPSLAPEAKGFAEVPQGILPLPTTEEDVPTLTDTIWHGMPRRCVVFYSGWLPLDSIGFEVAPGMRPGFKVVPEKFTPVPGALFQCFHLEGGKPGEVYSVFIFHRLVPFERPPYIQFPPVPNVRPGNKS